MKPLPESLPSCRICRRSFPVPYKLFLHKRLRRCKALLGARKLPQRFAVEEEALDRSAEHQPDTADDVEIRLGDSDAEEEEEEEEAESEVEELGPETQPPKTTVDLASPVKAEPGSPQSPDSPESSDAPESPESPGSPPASPGGSGEQQTKAISPALLDPKREKEEAKPTSHDLKHPAPLAQPSTKCPNCPYDGASLKNLSRHLDNKACQFHREREARRLLREQAEGGRVAEPASESKPQGYQACRECGYVPRGPGRLESHLQKNLCLMMKMKAYIKDVNGAPGPRCQGCSETFKSSKGLVRHLHSRNLCLINRKLGVLATKCPVCPIVAFHKPQLLRKHLLRTSPECLRALQLPERKRQVCEECSLTLWDPDMLRKHKESKFGCALVKDGSLGGAEVDSKAKVKKPVPGSKKHTCPSCGVTHDTRQKMERHLANPRACGAYKLRSYALALTGGSEACPKCRFVGVSKAQLVRHLRSAKSCAAEAAAKQLLKDGLTDCPRCRLAFPSKGRLYSHLSGLGGRACRLGLVEDLEPKPLPCQACPVVYYDADLLRRHADSRFGCQLTNDGVIPAHNRRPGQKIKETKAATAPTRAKQRFACPSCPFQAKYQVALEKHRRRGETNCVTMKIRHYVREVTAQTMRCPQCQLEAKSGHFTFFLKHLSSQRTCASMLAAKGMAEAGAKACPACQEPFASREDVCEHFVSKRGVHCRRNLTRDAALPERSAPCVGCSLSFASPVLLDLHRKSRYGCDLTRQGVVSSDQVKSVKVKEFACQECPFSTAVKERLERHRAKDTNCVQFKLRHNLLEMTGGTMRCPGCELDATGQSTLLVKHLVSLRTCAHTRAAKALAEAGAKACPSCETPFATKDDVWDHVHSKKGMHCMRRHSQADELPERSEPCSECQLSFAFKDLLPLHRKSRYGCELAKQGVLSPPEAKADKLDGDKPHSFICESCDFSVPTQDRLERHKEAGSRACTRIQMRSYMRQLTGQREAQPAPACDACGFTANASTALLRHLHSTRCAGQEAAVQALLEDGVTECPVCRCAHDSAEELREHLAQESGCRAGLPSDPAEASEFRCDDCQALFFRLELLRRHGASRFGCELTKGGAVGDFAFRPPRRGGRRPGALKAEPEEEEAEESDEEAHEDPALKKTKARASGAANQTASSSLCPDCDEECRDNVALDKHRAKGLCDRYLLQRHAQEMVRDGKCPECSFAGVPSIVLKHRYNVHACLRRRIQDRVLSSGATRCPKCLFPMSAAELRKHLTKLPVTCLKRMSAEQWPKLPLTACEGCGRGWRSEGLVREHRGSRLGCRVVARGLLLGEPLPHLLQAKTEAKSEAKTETEPKMEPKLEPQEKEEEKEGKTSESEAEDAAEAPAKRMVVRMPFMGRARVQSSAPPPPTPPAKRRHSPHPDFDGAFCEACGALFKKYGFLERHFRENKCKNAQLVRARPAAAARAPAAPVAKVALVDPVPLNRRRELRVSSYMPQLKSSISAPAPAPAPSVAVASAGPSRAAALQSVTSAGPSRAPALQPFVPPAPQPLAAPSPPRHPSSMPMSMDLTTLMKDEEEPLSSEEEADESKISLPEVADVELKLEPHEESFALPRPTAQIDLTQSESTSQSVTAQIDFTRTEQMPQAATAQMAGRRAPHIADLSIGSGSELEKSEGPSRSKAEGAREAGRRGKRLSEVAPAEGLRCDDCGQAFASGAGLAPHLGSRACLERVLRAKLPPHLAALLNK